MSTNICFSSLFFVISFFFPFLFEGGGGGGGEVQKWRQAGRRTHGLGNSLFSRTIYFEIFIPFYDEIYHHKGEMQDMHLKNISLLTLNLTVV